MPVVPPRPRARWSTYAMQQRVDEPGGVDGAVLEDLSDRGREVLVLLARGLSDVQVADDA